MGTFQWFLLFCVCIIILFKRFRVLSYVLNLFFTHKLKLRMCLGHVSLLPPIAADSHFILGTVAVHVNKVRLTSSLVNADIKRLLGLIIEDVRLTKDFNYSQGRLDLNQEAASGIARDVHSDLQKLLPALTTFVQFMCISVTNVTVVAERSGGELVHASVNNVTLDGSILPRSQISLCVVVDGVSSRLLQTAATGERCRQPCLAELSFTAQIEAHVSSTASTKQFIQRCSVLISRPLLAVDERLLPSLRNKRKVASLERSHGPTLQDLWPQNFDLSMTGTELKVTRGDQTADIKTLLHFVNVSLETSVDHGDEHQLETKGNLRLLSLHSETRTERWLSLSEATASFQIGERGIDCLTTVNRLSLVYTHSELSPWLSLLVDKSNAAADLPTNTQPRRRPLTFKLEAWDFSTVVTFQNALPLRMGLTHLQMQGARGVGTPEGEFQAESLWCCLGSRPPSDPGQKKLHFWNSPLYVGLVICKREVVRADADLQLVAKTRLLLDIVRLEWSPNLIQTLTAVESGLSRWKLAGSAPVSSHKNSTIRVRQLLSVTASGVNVFLLTKKEAALMFRIDSVAAETNLGKVMLSVEGFKGLFINVGAPFSCAKSADIKKGNLQLDRLQLTVRANKHNLELENPAGNWDTRLHMTILQVLDECLLFLANRGPPHPSGDHSCHPKSEPSSWIVTVKEKLTICATLSSQHGVQLETGNVNASRTSGPGLSSSFELSIPTCTVLFDGHSIVEAHDLTCVLADHNQQLTAERIRFGCHDLTNRCGLVTVGELRLCFPYQYPMAEACQQDFINVFKWLKHTHKERATAATRPTRSTEPTDQGHLYRDIRVSIGNFSMQLSDDPFEVTLRDNYALRLDEYRESVKRKRMLDGKIEELRRTHPLLTQGKVDELYANLACKNAEIYVQFAQRKYADGRQVRTALFRWEMINVDVMALADPSLNGYNNIVRNIQDMDPDTSWPDEGVSFTTLWCRAVRATCRQWRFQLRDFPQPLFHIEELLLFGRLAGAEQQSSWRSRRSCRVHIGQPWSDVFVERGMNALKFYYDFSCDAERMRLAYGPCWEPVIAQCSLAWDLISAASKDPSPPLAIWDKLRLIYHGRLTLAVQQLTLLLHTSLDPYSTTEEMELTWTDLVMDWTNANFIFKGDFDVYVRTASKYDDCRLLHLSRLKLTARLTWHCLADPNDHHAVTPCAPDRVPEYSINQEHDSYRAFRSQNVTLSLSMETRPSASNTVDVQALLYGSTLRWFENLKFILSGVSRPTRRGPLFDCVKPRKIQLSRHYKAVRLALSLHRFHVCYWMSVSMQRGFELNCARWTLSSEHSLRLATVEDGLKHRPRTDWSIVFLNCELQDAEVWLQSALGGDSEESGEQLNVSLRQPVEKFYLLSVQRLSYGREAALTRSLTAKETSSSNVPTHRLVVQDLRAAWTKSNRQVVFALYDSWIKAQVLKKNLSSEVMKLLRLPESSVSPMKPRPSGRPPATSLVTPAAAAVAAAVVAEQSGCGSTPQTKPTAARTSVSSGGSGGADLMLQQLLADFHHGNVAFSEDLTTGPPTARANQSTTTTAVAGQQNSANAGGSADQQGVHLNWLIELVNSQVLLKGCETKGYVIISAAQARILQHLHPPVWRERSLVSKTSWHCSLDGMQYFATISAGEQDAMDENILWLNTDLIGARDVRGVVNLPDMVGSGQSVGGVITETVGGCDSAVELQRIVSRCKCELVYISYGQDTLDIEQEGLLDIPPPPSDDVMDLWAQREAPVDSFTLTHHDLDICTNSLQYEMLLDVINNLLLYVEAHRKEASERLLRLRFQLQLSSTQDQRRPVQQMQNQLRSLVSQLRRLEKDTYLLQRALAENPSDAPLLAQIDNLERQVYDCKEQLNASNEELAMMVSCLKEAQLSAHQRLQAARQGEGNVTTLRMSEINFKHAQWRLTEADGQLGIADVVLSNFLYNKLSRSDDSCEHSLEIGYVSVTNLLPNQLYKQVIVPTELNRNMPVDRQIAVRMFSRDKAPVGGICIKEIFEVNVVPFTFAMTYQFFKTMMRFCFPEKDPESLDSGSAGDQDHSISEGTASGTGTLGVRKGAKHLATKPKRSKESSFYVSIDDKDDVEKMKERAEKNKLFIYIKIPEVPVKVSYKGGKEKNIEDVHELSLVIPTLEYHNVTWTWLDLFLAMKNDSKRVLLSQAIKQKLLIRPRVDAEERTSPHEEDKARLLLGGLSLPGDARLSKKGFFKLAPSKR